MNIILNEVVTVRRAYENFKKHGIQAAKDYVADSVFTSSDIEQLLSLENFQFQNLTHSEGEFVTTTRSLDKDKSGDIVVTEVVDEYLYELHCTFMNDDLNLAMTVVVPTIINITADIKSCGVTRFKMNKHDNDKLSFDDAASFNTFLKNVLNIEFDTKNHMQGSLTTVHESLSTSQYFITLSTLIQKYEAALKDRFFDMR